MRLMLLVLFLAGCAGTPDTRQAQMESLSASINAQRDAGLMKYAEGQRQKFALYQQLYPNDSDGAEFFTYSIMLAEKVDAGTMTAAEYKYLVTKLQNELQERASNDRARRAQAAAAVMQAMPKNEPIQYQPVVQPTPLKRPTQTNCYTDSLGYTRCTTY